METVLTMAAQQEELSAQVADVITVAQPGDSYMAWKLGESAGQRPLLVERFGDGDPKMAVVAGLDGSDEAVLTAERLRALLLGLILAPEAAPDAPLDAFEGSVFLVTVANPDGLAAGRRLDNDGLAPDECFPSAGWNAGPVSGDAPLAAPEAAALAEFLEDVGLSAALVLREGGWTVGGDGEATAIVRRLRNDLNIEEDPALSGRPGSLAAWLGELGVPTATLGVSPIPAAHSITRAENAADALLNALRSVR